MRYGLIGRTLKHSFSKLIHESYGEYEYELIELDEKEFDDFMVQKDFTAINVTIPYKEKVIPYLDYVDDDVSIVGACNLIVNKDGKLYGYNTDIMGLMDLINVSKISLENKKVLILGTGGTSKTAAFVAKKYKAKEIIFASRTKKENAFTYEEIYENHLDSEIIINTTPVGMYPNIEETPINLEGFTSLSGVIDVIYNPLNTRLVLKARELEIPSISGLHMFVSQAVNSYGIFTNNEVYMEDILYKFIDFHGELYNVSFIGMPGCGKSTMGEKYAKALDKKWIDTDYEIENIVGMSIKDFIEKNGEEEFRKIEKEVVKKVSFDTNQVISTGGGVILDKENILNLKSNGTVIFIDKDIDELVFDESRPLSNTKEKLEKLYEERIELYRKYADFVLDKNNNFLVEGDEDEDNDIKWS